MQIDDEQRQKQQWIQHSQNGDLNAFGKLVRTNQDWLRGWLRGQLRDWTAADDLAQDAFITAFQKIKSYRGDGNFESWLRSIAHNHFRNYIRKHREEYIGGNEELQNLLVSDPFQDAHNNNPSIDALRHCLSMVKGRSSELLEERYLNGKSVRAIAEQEGMGYSTMTMKIHRLRKSLASCIENQLTSRQS